MAIDSPFVGQENVKRSLRCNHVLLDALPGRLATRRSSAGTLLVFAHLLAGNSALSRPTFLMLCHAHRQIAGRTSHVISPDTLLLRILDRIPDDLAAGSRSIIEEN